MLIHRTRSQLERSRRSRPVVVEVRCQGSVCPLR